MKQAQAPQCPDCTYLLEGLTVPRCPECGLDFDARLLTDPRLARPRPAWERRPHVGLLRAAWATLIDVTVRPRAFFDSIQQPDRLRRTLTWPIFTIAVLCLFVATYVFAANHIKTYGPWTWGMSWPEYCGAVLAGVGIRVLYGVVLVFLPLAVLLAVADLALWRDRTRFRLLFKCVCYSLTVHVWTALSICLTAAGITAWSELRGEYSEPQVLWTNWILVVAVTWQYALIFFAALGPRFAALLPARRAVKEVLLWLVVAVWMGAVYLTLYDQYLGLRFMTASWSWEILR